MEWEYLTRPFSGYSSFVLCNWTCTHQMGWLNRQQMQSRASPLCWAPLAAHRGAEQVHVPVLAPRKAYFPMLQKWGNHGLLTHALEVWEPWHTYPCFRSVELWHTWHTHAWEAKTHLPVLQKHGNQHLALPNYLTPGNKFQEKFLFQMFLWLSQDSLTPCLILLGLCMKWASTLFSSFNALHKGWHTS